MPSFLILHVAPASTSPVPSASGAEPIPSTGPQSSISSFKSLGFANPEMPVLVSVVLPLRNLGTLSSLVKDVSDPNSPNFRQFLTQAEASQEFLPTASDYQSVVNYLTNSGFKVELTALNSSIVVSGTVSMVKQYLGQSVDMYTNGTYSYYQTTGASSLFGAYSYASNSTGLLMRPDFVKSSTAGSGTIPAQNVTFTEGAQSMKVLQTVYNTTGLLAKGDNGKGYTIGLLDFYGNSLVSQDLQTYDQTFGFPAPPSFKIDPIGPYNPNLGTAEGWDGEIDLDVQASHSMAPGANLILYAGNGALPLSTAIAAIVQDDKANVVSQSFGNPEWEYYEAGPDPYLFNLVFADDYYMLGSAMGMSFLSSSGDAGGSGYSAGPMDGSQYPAVSPFVTSLGGTATYVSNTTNGGLSINQTAWSGIGFIPYFVNEGGGGGGVSSTEPTPWYQSSLPVPPSFPNGRMVPDLSLDSSGEPGAYIIYQGAPIAIGGTSEASPLFAGLLAVIMSSQKGSLGLVNPVLYSLAENTKTYTTAFTPITFGYIIPWTSKFGYNLATGWGAPNIGEIARLYSSAKPSNTLSVSVLVTNPTKDNFTDFTPGQKMTITAVVLTPADAPLTSGTVTATLQTIGGTSAAVPLTFSATSHSWTATSVTGNESGVTYVNVEANNGAGTTGFGFAPTFTGYLANYIQPLAPYPWTFLTGLESAISITDLFGNLPELANGGFPSQETVSFQSYSMLNNTYKSVGSALLNFSGDDEYYEGLLTDNFPSGPMAMVTTGDVVGYLPFISGIGLAGTDIYPQVVAEPGSVSPGQSITIVASVTAPENIYEQISYATGNTIGAAMAVGTNVTATLVSPTGQKLVTVTLPEEPCAQSLKVCASGSTLINGYLQVPANATPGLYTVLLGATYNDETTAFTYTGGYFGQIYVAAGSSSASITVGPTTMFEGQTATVTASITYPNGKEVTHGVYTALVYPANAEYGYSTIMHSTYEAFGLTPLTYDATLGAWTASLVLPSPSGAGSVSGGDTNAEYYGGPYDVYVSGISADGVPTNSSMSAQQPFDIQPYVYTTGTINELPQATRLAFANATISLGSSPLTLADDYFVGTNTISGTAISIANSVIQGTLDIKNSQVTLSGVTGGAVVATEGTVALQHTSLSSLELSSGSTASMDSSSSSTAISPRLPVLTISAPSQNASYTGTVNVNVGIQGTNVTSVSFILDGQLLPNGKNVPSAGAVALPLNTASLADGTHTLVVEAVQSDLLTTNASVTFSTHNQLAAVSTQLGSANKTISSLSSSLSSVQSGLNADNKTIQDLTYLGAGALVAALAAIAVAAFSLRSGKSPWKY